MTDIFPPARQRGALLALREALGVRDNSLRRDECGDWAIFGKNGRIYAAPGSLDQPQTPGFQICLTGSARLWTNAKAAFSRFADLVNDGDDEGMHFLFRLPTAAEAETIRHYVGLAKKREVSEAERERLTSLGRRFGKRSDVEGAQTGQKPASEAGEGSQEAGTLEEGRTFGEADSGQDDEANP